MRGSGIYDLMKIIQSKLRRSWQMLMLEKTGGFQGTEERWSNSSQQERLSQLVMEGRCAGAGGLGERFWLLGRII